jgi:hypothetical protein
MAYDLFDTREMLPMLEEAKPANTFLKSLFFSNDVTFDTAHVDIDIWAGKRRLAPIVAPRFGSKTVERTGYSAKTYTPAQVAPDMITTAEDLLKRMPGETIYGMMSPDERAAAQLTKDMLEMEAMITRREEEMCSQALFTGQVNMVGEGVNDTVQYWSQLAAQDQPITTLTGGALWSADTATIDKNIRDWRRSTVKRSGIGGTDAILGTDAADALLANVNLRKLMDTRRIDMGLIQPELLPDGVTYLGQIRGSGVDLWSYDEWYLDESDDTEKPMVPADSVLLGSRNARTSMLYGCVVDPVQGSFAAPRVPVSYTQRKPVEGRVLAVKSRPLPAIHQIYGFHVAKVV